MNLRPLAYSIPLLCLAPTTGGAQQTLLATAVGPSYDVVANCLTKRMAPRLSAAPVVRPPPANRAEVHLYVPGTEKTGTPVASFFVSQLDGGNTTIAFEERADQRARHISVARSAAALCAR